MQSPARDLSRPTRIGLTLIAGGAVATIYYNQPLLAVLVAEFGERAALLVPTASLVGYGLGILFLVPLGDALPRRDLIVRQLLGLALALVVAGLAPNLAVLTLASLAIGVLACAAQQAVPFAAELAPDATRGRIVGGVMTGLLSGILLARTASGLVGAHLGWRSVFLAAAIVSVVLAFVAWRTLPRIVPKQRLRYRALMLSLVHLVRTQPVLRNASLTQALLFASFNAFWATLALLVEAPPFGLTSAGAGLFGVIGVAGALIAPHSGRYSDRRGARPVVIAGSVFVAAAFAVLALAGQTSLAAIGLGVLLLDIGINGALIANQTRAYALVPGARGRINTVLFTAIFVGGALGAFGGSQAFLHAGWPGVCAVGGSCALAALAVALLDRRRSVT
ncbi:putative MFS family arabinose efflux permease [Methylorubrum rhodinum]|uniref:Putative MFS family arabinose efflux permease n=1 Tax=Methylorubrum rhodinum TaxID=29428 RepID=A0A840ZD89_9HYPH|nr:MFS transporter [Methylorubrum rhodinum]MBB5755579.1 putative MFS family arabinose efflux permease [Methylorubrum rhodinum]